VNVWCDGFLALVDKRIVFTSSQRV